MAVSMTQLSQDSNKQRSMAYYPAEATHMPIPQHYQFQQFPQTYMPPPPSQYHSGAYQPYAHLYEQSPAPPPRPPKTPIDASATLEISPPKPPRPNSSSSLSPVVPDLLPPHSNPHALTATQSRAFESASPGPSVRIGKDEIWSSKTGFALYIITRQAAHAPSFLSSKPFLTVARAEGGQVMGAIRFHSISTSAIDIIMDGRQTSITHSGFVHNRWGFQSLTCPNINERWYWKKDKAIGGVKLEDSKKSGRILARIRSDLLTFEHGDLNEATRNEILISAIAMAEAARRSHRNKEIADLAGAIGDFASSAGGGDGGSGDGGGGGGGSV